MKQGLYFYTQAGCQPCKELKTKLEKKGVYFTTVDLTDLASDESIAELESLKEDGNFVASKTPILFDWNEKKEVNL